ncbi:SH3 domain-containing protein [Deinococcus pimensis]|uniref:C40 family peptidase n=1 Tax=Deinococcus pimensis TaxID=309888 RepID=UPI0004AF8488|nr:SH3 domain-containing protein [Deinococcus pimensis]
MNTTLDQRITPLDEERRVADVALRDRLGGGWTWLTPVTRAAARGRVSLRARPDGLSPQVTEALLGETVEVLEERPDGWAWVRTAHDGYLGYTRLDALGTPPAGETLLVRAPRGHLFAGPKVSAPLLDELACGARLSRLDDRAYDENGRTWFRVAYGGGEAYVQAALVSAGREHPERARDLAFIARLLDTPYVWGGRSAWGIDCSGLAQLFHPHGALPRDADQQRDFLPRVETPRAGDLAFFPGHVGVMLGEREMLHANATHMRVTVETIGEGDYGRRLAESLEGYGRWDGTFFREELK